MMQRKPGYSAANCSIKMPENMIGMDIVELDEVGEQNQRRQQLINFGHSLWGFNNWSWSVTKQDLDFVDFSNGKYCAGVAAFVSISVKTLEIHRENVGYATTVATNKGLAICKSRKCAVTNALRETFLSFGGSVASELADILDTAKSESVPDVSAEPKAPPKAVPPTVAPANRVPPQPQPPPLKNAAAVMPLPAAPTPVGVAKPGPAPNVVANRAPPTAPRPPPAPTGPRPNVSFVLPVMPPMYGPRLPPPAPMYPNYYEYGPSAWHFTYESFDRHHGNVNLNFNLPPKNLVVNGRGSVECKNACGRPPGLEGEPIQYGPPPQNQGCWVKPTIFYDGFWTEQKVKKWVAEQVEKQFPEDSGHKSSSPSGSGSGSHNDPPFSKS